MERLLRVRNLRVWFNVRIGLVAGFLGKEQKHVRAVDGISFDVRRGEVFCLVGESGCGKTTTGKALIRLNEPTQGTIFLDVPDEHWVRYTAQAKRLAELEGMLANMDPADREKNARALPQLRRLMARLAKLRNPKRGSKVEARRKRIETTIEVLDVREKALLEAQDSAVNRMVSQDRVRLEVMKTLGPWFTIPRAQKLERLEKELKEATFRHLRAEAGHGRVGSTERLVRRLQRRIDRTRERVHTGDAETVASVEQLQQTLSTKEKQLTELELARVAEERDAFRAKLASVQTKRRPATENRIEHLEAAIAKIRQRGDPALEAFEIRASMDEIRDQYDVATWGRKDQPRIPGQRGRRKLFRTRMRRLRRKVQIIYQDPYESLNPKLSIFDIVSEPLTANRVVSTQAEAEAVVAKALEDVGLRPSAEYMFRYPHELSGGQRQRVGIATALVVDPDFIVADEPVSMLDASVRTEILALLLELKKRRDLTYLFITHDLGLAWILADRIAVMYLGKIVETGDAPEIIQNPRHPYTKALISVVPSPNPKIRREKVILRGERPDPVDIPAGCRFHPRCPMAVGICGWNSDEVSQELKKLLEEDRATFSEAASVTDVTVTGPFSLRVATPIPGGVEKYLWKRLQSVALGRPALGAIRRATANGGILDLTLHQPVEPSLRTIRGNIEVACHLVEPEIGQRDEIAIAK